MRIFMFTLLLPALLVTGCVSATTSSTPRTAVEMALLSEAAERAIGQLDDAKVFYDRFYLDVGDLEATDEEYVINRFRHHMLKKGMHHVTDKDDADVVVYPAVAIAAMDESQVLLGIPSLPLIIPGAGTIVSPELAIFKRHSQRGRHKIAAYGVDARDDSYAFDLGTGAAKVHYTRWTVLLFFTFATTNLTDPYPDYPFGIGGRGTSKGEE